MLIIQCFSLDVDGRPFTVPLTEHRTWFSQALGFRQCAEHCGMFLQRLESAVDKVSLHVFLSASLRPTSRTVYAIHPFHVYNSVVFSVSTELWNHHQCLIPEHCQRPRESPSRAAVSPFTRPAQAATCLLPFSRDLPVLHISYGGNPTMCGRLCLASYMWHVFKDHPH